jgi:16S rRNA (uracil1498-N3)-methyltransferase
VLDGLGWEYVVELVDLQAEQGLGRILERRRAVGEPRVFVTLYAALLKGQHLEWVLQKGTELGVSAFVPIVTLHTVVRDVGRGHKKQARWERIIREAAEQCRQGRVPHLSAPLSFDSACQAAASDHEAAFLPWVQEAELGLSEALQRLSAGRGLVRLALLIGPEGGFHEDEVRLARETGIHVVSLGARTLRAETAALAAVTLVLGALGELGGRDALTDVP